MKNMTKETLISANPKSQNQNNRRPRFKRAADVEVQITERDRDILKLVADYRFLHNEHLQLLTNTSLKPLQRRLYKLYHNHYLDRPKVQLYTWERGNGTKKIVYALGNKGADVLAGDGIPRGRIDWAKKNADIKHAFLEHTLGISDFRAAMTAAALQQGFTTSKWIKGNDAGVSISWKDEDYSEVRIPLVPDGFFTLENSDYKMHFFLEYDTGSMPVARRDYQQTSIKRKIEAYFNLWREDKLYRKNKTPQPSILSKAFGVSSFRVLFVTTTIERIENMLMLCRSLPTAQELFCFTTKNAFNLSNSKRLLEPIWVTPKKVELQSLLED